MSAMRILRHFDPFLGGAIRVKRICTATFEELTDLYRTCSVIGLQRSLRHTKREPSEWALAIAHKAWYAAATLEGEELMSRISWLKNHLVASALVVLAVLVTSLYFGHGRANAQNGFVNDNNGAQDEKRAIQIGYSVAPVPLNTTGLNADLVGLGSYIVNVTGDCNGCHSAGPATEFLPHGNPYTRKVPNGPYLGVAQTNPATYLGGGRDFGGFPAPTSPLHIISRNLTPDASGKPEGHTLAEFFTILRTGVDMDRLHPNCTGVPTSSCTPFPFDGDKLLVMRWPAFRHMTDRQITAIYQYLSAVPCIQGADPNETPNRCQ
jgi:hypothetical protein